MSRHAPGAQVRVVVDSGDGTELGLLVEDDGSPGAFGSASGNGDGGPGRGLLGMRERVALFGGSLVTGPRAEGGFRVHATPPLAER